MEQKTNQSTERDNSTSVDLFNKIVDLKKMKHLKDNGVDMIPLAPLMLFFLTSLGAFLVLFNIDVEANTSLADLVALGLMVAVLGIAGSLAVFVSSSNKEFNFIYKDYKGLAWKMQNKFDVNPETLSGVVRQKSILGLSFHVIDKEKLKNQISDLEQALLVDEINDPLSKKIANIASYIDHASINENSLKFKIFSEYAKKVNGDDNKAQRLLMTPNKPMPSSLSIVESD